MIILRRIQRPSLAYPGDVVTIRKVWFWEFTPRDKIRQIRRDIDAGSSDPLIHELAASIVAQCPPRDRMSETQAILSWVQNSVRYLPEKEETFQSAPYTARKRYGDCDDMIIQLGALLESIMIPTKVEVIGWSQPGEGFQYRHVYLRAGFPTKSPRRWIALESTMNVPAGWEPRSFVAKMLAQKTVPGL